MSIPDNVFAAFPPIPYASFRDQVRNGDIVLCQGREPFSRLIQWATESPWSHAGLVFRLDEVDQVIVVEAVEKIGVRAVALSEFLSRNSEGVSPFPGKILLARHDQLKAEADPHAVRELAKFAFDHLGDRFASGDILKIALRIAHARLFGSDRTPKMLLPDGEFICSEFVAGAYAEAGLKIPWDGLGFVAPCDIANDPHLQPVAQADVAHPPRPQGKARR